MKLKRLLSGALALTLCFSLSAQALAADQSEQHEVNPFPILYEGKDHDMVKISHPTVPQSQRKVGFKHADGMVDYLGNGRLGVPGKDEGADNQGSRGQSYAWAAWGYDDYIYVNTSYAPAMATANLFPDSDPEEAALRDKITNIMYRGDMFYGEEDGAKAGSVLVKINVKTGELKIVMDAQMTEDSYGNNYGGFYEAMRKRNGNGINPLFRNAVELNGKIYFCGSPASIPSIWEVDPETDMFRRVYADPALVKDPSLIGKAVYEDGLCVAIRGMTVMDGHLVISCVGPDINPYIMVSNTDDIAKDGFTKIASTWDEESWAVDQQEHGWPEVDEDGNVITKKGELLGYPACHIKDAVFGGSIFEMIPYNGDLYVSICSGSLGNLDEGGTYPGNSVPENVQSFAVIRGHYEGDIADRSSWTWEPVIGDKADGALYEFGIDPERTRAAAATLMVVGDNLYIGEYNDTEIATTQMLDGFNMRFMADNLEQAVNLYRLDSNDHIDMIVGSKTDMFPKGSISGLESGFGQGKVDHGNQYIWRMEEFQDKLCIGTFDESDILHPFGQLTNGDLIGMDALEWADQLSYVWNFIRYIIGEKNEVDPELEALAAQITPDQEVMLKEMYHVGSEMQTMMAEEHMDALSLPALMSENGAVDSLNDLYQAMVLVPNLLTQDDSWTLDQKIQAKNDFIRLYKNMTEVYMNQRIKLPGFIQNIFDKLLKNETVQKLSHVARTLYYLKDCTEGFDFYMWDDERDKMEVITRDGMGDPYNNGLRVFAKNESEDNPWLCLGTANMFYGTQIWRLEGEGLNLPTWHNPFTDVHEGDYFYDAVKWGDMEHVTSGVTPSLFAPGKTCTRAEIVTFLWNQAGQPAPETNVNPFRDVDEEDWFYEAVLWAVENHVTAGVSATEFAPERTCTRAQAMTFLWKRMGRPVVKAYMPFTDDVKESDWFYEAVKWAASAGVTIGTTDTTFGAQEPCTRGQIITFLFRLFAE